MNELKTFEQKFNESFLMMNGTGGFSHSDFSDVRKAKNSIKLDFFNRNISVSANGVDDVSGRPLTMAVKYLLCQYLPRCTEKAGESSNRLVSIREFSNAGPLYSSFAANTGKIIETTFSGDVERLKQRCISLGGIAVQNASYDLSIRFKALSRLPVILNFNDKDEFLPACAVFLFHENAITYLDLECLTIICTWLTGQLISDQHDLDHL